MSAVLGALSGGSKGIALNPNMDKEKEEGKKEEREEENGEDGEEEEEEGNGEEEIVLGPQLPLKEQLEKDKVREKEGNPVFFFFS